MQKNDLDLLKRGLLDKKTIALFSVMTFLSAFALGEHIFFRFPWKNNTMTHGRCIWLYLFPPILAVALIGAFKIVQGVELTSVKLRSAVQEMYNNGVKKGTIKSRNEEISEMMGKINETAYSLEQSFKPRRETMLIISAILSVACITVAGCLDNTTHPAKVKTLAIIESALLGSTLVSLLALCITLYFTRAAKSLQNDQPQQRKRIYAIIETLQLADPLAHLTPFS
ncbi:hypothetical protein [Neorickettsia findlayensis]|uniref:Uncharacterized protein n=1 Tax=Neorickettsia findlayensis TaxID=2686014 RepID=A0A6P1G9L1_9RICK|nr:hypothetical protein [Neorickettsia findlayensis]QHD64923.1 hypothetical protein GP480_00325 [Neorickettsia findlayensis]